MIYKVQAIEGDKSLFVLVKATTIQEAVDKFTAAHPTAVGTEIGVSIYTEVIE